MRKFEEIISYYSSTPYFVTFIILMESYNLFQIIQLMFTTVSNNIVNVSLQFKSKIVQFSEAPSQIY